MTARVLTIAGLVAAPVGIGILILAGGLSPDSAAPAIGAAVAAFLLIGGLVSGQAVELLSDPGEIDRFAGMAVLILGVIVALVAGIVATVQGRRLRR